MIRSGRPLPQGTPTFLFTDVEGSTKLLQRLGSSYSDTLELHRSLLLDACSRHGGVAVGHEGDSLFMAFETAADATAAALDGQRSLAEADWPEGEQVRVRMGIHTGPATVVGDNYVGMAVHIAARVSAAGHGGQVLVTAVTAELAGLPPAIDLGLHALKDVGEFRLHQLTAAHLEVDFPPLRSLSANPNNLPALVDQFVGRQSELRAIVAALERGRLVTLTGAGGCGKTRLALEAASTVMTRFADGVWMIELATVSEASRVAAAIGQVLRLHGHGDESVDETVLGWLEEREVLLILDNCEHLLDGVARLCGEMLARCRNVRILATSREYLGIRGEHAIPTPPLAVPDDLDAATGSEAVELFLARAAATTGFDVEGVDTRLAAHLCRRLDGLPLAIELAAARLRSLSLAQLAARLDDRFRILTGGVRADLPRQRTLEAVVAWSFELLSESERRVFRRLSVFPDHFTVEMAEAVASDALDDPLDVVDSLLRLVEKSLVAMVDVGGDARYRLLETLRHYGLDRLIEAEDVDDVRDRLLSWALESAAEIENVLRTPAMDDALHEAQLNEPTFRRAMEWALVRGRAHDALRIAAVVPIEVHKGARRAEIVSLLEQATSDGEVDDRMRGFAFSAIANLALDQGEWTAALDASERADVHFRCADLPHQAAWATFIGMHASWGLGDLARTDQLIDRVIQQFRGVEDDMGLGYALWVASLRTPDAKEAVVFSEQADRLLRTQNSPMGIAHNAEGRGIIALRAGDLVSAASHVADAVARFSAYENVGCTAHALEAAAVVLSRSGHPRAAVELVIAADDLRRRSGQGHRPWEVRATVGGVDEIADALDAASAQAARRAGSEHDLRSAAASALRGLQALADGRHFGSDELVADPSSSPRTSS